MEKEVLAGERRADVVGQDVHDRLLTLDEAGVYLGLEKDHRAPDHAVRYLCRTRQLQFVKVGKTLRFRPEWLDEYVDSHSIPPIRRER